MLARTQAQATLRALSTGAHCFPTLLRWRHLPFTTPDSSSIYARPTGTKLETSGRRTAGYRLLCVLVPRNDGWLEVKMNSRNVGAADGSGVGLDIAEKIAQLLRKKGVQLVLHFDLNKTLILVETAGGKTQTQVLNSVLAEISWGRVERGQGQSRWTWNGCAPTPEPCPISASNGAAKNGTENNGRQERDGVTSLFMTYSDFLYEEFGDAPDEDNRKMKSIRDQKKGDFTLKGHPGFGLRREYLELQQALSISGAIAKSPLLKMAGLAERGRYHLIPSFLECLVALKQAKADFSIVFRTFGSDIEGVAREYNVFCEGRHPLFPGITMDGSDGEADYRVHMHRDDGYHDGQNNGSTAGASVAGPYNIGAFYRDEEGPALVMGTLDNPNNRSQLRSAEEKGYAVHRTINTIHDAIFQAVCPPLQPPSEATSTPRNIRSVHRDAIITSGQKDTDMSAPIDAINSSGMRKGDKSLSIHQNADRRCLALRDFYPFWRSRLEEAEAGKLLPVDLSKDPKVWSIMFDDNIGRLGSTLGAHIVDVRDCATGKAVPFDVAMRQHLVRAEPFQALLQGKNYEEAPPAACDKSSELKSNGNYFLVEVLQRLTREGRVGPSLSALEP